MPIYGSDRPARPLLQAGLLALVPIAPSARCEERPQPGPVIAIARPPAQQAFRLAVRDPAVLAVKGAPLSRKPGLGKALQRRQRDVQQRAGVFDHPVLAARKIVDRKSTRLNSSH